MKRSCDRDTRASRICLFVLREHSMRWYTAHEIEQQFRHGAAHLDGRAGGGRGAGKGQNKQTVYKPCFSTSGMAISATLVADRQQLYKMHTIQMTRPTMLDLSMDICKKEATAPAYSPSYIANGETENRERRGAANRCYTLESVLLGNISPVWHF